MEVAKYWAMCEWFHETCGQLLDFLDTRKLAENTLVIFLADNGWIQDPQADRYAPGSKQSPYEGGIPHRDPGALAGQGRPADLRIPVSAIDIVPTVLKETASAISQGMEGSTCSTNGP